MQLSLTKAVQNYTSQTKQNATKQKTMTNPITLHWLEGMFDHMADIKPRRKNIVDIAGYPNWENVNSNILAFFLDEKEEHKLERLFFDSLLDVIEDNLENKKIDRTTYDTPFTVERETNRIDILIHGGEEDGQQAWAIIIENKIHHILNNDLNKYWESVQADTKLGIVLNLHALEKPISINLKNGQKVRFVNITHIQLIEKVQENLGRYFENGDDRHLLFLKDYFSNIKSHYQMKQPSPITEQNMKEIQKYDEQIARLNDATNDAKYYVFYKINTVMAEVGFTPHTNYLGVWKHYYQTNNKGERLPLRIYIDLIMPVYKNRLVANLELHDDYTEYGKDVRKLLEEKGLYSKAEGLKKGDASGSGWFHIAVINRILDNSDNNFEDAVRRGLQPFFSKKENTPSFFESVAEITNQVIESKRNNE